MEADCQWKNLVWRLSPSRGLGRKINEQDRSSIESEDNSRCSDRYFGVFYDTSRNCTNGNAYCKIHTIMRLGRILGPVSSFLIHHFLYLCAICAWRTAFPIPVTVIANIPCLGQLQNLIRVNWFEIKYPV